MGEIMSMHMWSERSKEVVADTKKMVVQIGGMYKRAYSYYLLQQMRKELAGSNEQSTLLTHRKWQSYGRPLQTGPLYVMGGSEHRKWRRRFCVLQPDYTLEVYDSEEDFEAGNKPRFFRKHSSFEVVDNVDAHISQQIKDYMRDFGYITNNVSNVMKKLGSATDPSKRPTQHVLALSHPFRGKFYMAADTAVEKEKWLNSMLDASRQLEGIHSENESQRKAFAFAIRQACDAQEHCNIKVNMSGTQEEIISDFITDYLSNGCKAMLQTKVKGNPMKKYKMWDSISRHLAMTVQGIVKVEYPPVRRRAEEEAEELEPKMMAFIPQINAAYETASQGIIASLEAGYRYELEDRVLLKIPDLATKMGDSMSNCLHEVRDVFVSLADSMNRQVSASSSEFANNIDRYFVAQLDHAPRNPEVMLGVFQSVLGNKSPLKALDEAFPKLDYTQHERELCVLLQKLLDSAICTFEILCGEAVHKNKGQLHVTTIAKIQGRVLKKLGYDNMLLTKRFLNDVLLAVTYKIMKHTIDSEAKGKLPEFEDFIPNDYAEFMPAQNLYKDAVMGKLMEEIRPGVAAGLKRLANDHFSMVRYQSSSTIDSRSSACSTTSDEVPSKHEPTPRASPKVQKVTPISSLAVAKVGGEIEKEQSEDRGSDGEHQIGVKAEASSEGTSSHPDDGAACMDGETGEASQMDGETGETYIMDENGERILVPRKLEEPENVVPEAVVEHDVKEATPSHDLENKEESESSDSGSDASDEVASSSQKQDDLDAGHEDSPPAPAVDENVSCAESNPAEPAPLVADAVKQQEEDVPQVLENISTEDPVDSIVKDDQDQEDGVQHDQTSVKSDDKVEAEVGVPDVVEENIKDSPSLPDNTLEVEAGVPQVVEEIEDGSSSSDEDDVKNQDQCNKDEEVKSKAELENTDPECQKTNNKEEDVKVENLKKDEDSDQEDTDSHQEEIPPVVDDNTEKTAPSPLSNGAVTHTLPNGQQNGHHDKGSSGGGDNDQAPSVETTHSNGELKQRDPDADRTADDDEPPTPSPRKHKTPKSSPTHAVPDNNTHDEELRACAADSDLERYNGVLEQIIHTGEEKLI